MNDNKLTIQKLLKDLQFSDVEAETYWSLLGMEHVSIRKVSAASGINRGTTYDAIKRLVAEGLVSTRRVGEREYYAAESPERIYDLIREKRKDLWRSQQTAQKIIPEIIARKAKPTGKPLVKYYEGDEGIVTILKDVLSTCSRLHEPEYYVYSSKPLRHYLYRKFPKFTDKRISEGIFVKVIAIGEGGDPADNSSRKWLAETDSRPVSSYTIIYDDKVAIISLSKDETPYGVVIQDSGNAHMQKLLFEQMWQSM